MAADGTFAVQAATTLGLATIRGQAVEESNVDLSNELVTLIQFQRAFQAMLLRFGMTP